MKLSSSPHKMLLAAAMFCCFFGALFSRVIFDYFLFFVSVLVLFFAAKKLEGTTWRNLITPTGFGWVWPLWFASIVISLFANGLFSSGNFQDVFNFRWMIGMYFLARAFAIIAPSKKVIEGSIILVGIVSLGFLLNSLFQVGGFANLFYPHRLMGAYRNPNDYSHAYLLIACFGITYFFIEKSQDRLLRALLRLSLGTLCFSIFLTYSRTVWVSLLLVFIGVLIFTEKERSIKYLVLIGLALGGAYWFDIAGVRERADFTFETDAGALKDGRINLWYANWAMFQDHPLFGVGYNNNIVPLTEYHKKLALPGVPLISHAHNQYLQYLSTTGIFGALLYLSVFACFFYYGIKHLKLVNNREQYFLLIPTYFSFFGFLLAGLGDNNFDIYTVQPFLFILFSLGIYLNRQHSIS